MKTSIHKERKNQINDKRTKQLNKT